jgi:hypothetical protein
MIPTPIHLVRDLWVVLGLYWLMAAFRRTRAQKREPIGERLAHLLVMAAATVLLCYREPWWGILNQRFLPDAAWFAWAGVALTVAGVAVAIWARRHLGKYWSAEVTIRSGHDIDSHGAVRAHPSSDLYGNVAGARGDGAGDWRVPRACGDGDCSGRLCAQGQEIRVVSRRPIWRSF